VRPFVKHVEIIPHSLDRNKTLHKVIEQFDEKAVVPETDDKGLEFFTDPFAHKAGHDPLHDVPFGFNGFPFAVG